MKKIITALLACLALTACEEIIELMDGDWERMKWSHPLYRIEKIDGMTYFAVPAAGGEFAFRCKNYSKPWLSSDHQFEVDGVMQYGYLLVKGQENASHFFQYKWCTIEAVKDTIKVTFDANDGDARRARVSVTAGDIFDSFDFWQEGSK